MAADRTAADLPKIPAEPLPEAVPEIPAEPLPEAVPEIPAEPLPASEEKALEAVEAALYRRALGMTIREVRREATDKGEKTVVTEKQLAPDISAQMFLLKNRMPHRWQEKPEPPAPTPENNLLAILRQAAGDLEHPREQEDSHGV